MNYGLKFIRGPVMTTAGIVSGRSRCGGRNGRRHERGAILVWFALGLLVVVGFIGIAVDVGRMYLVRTEGQTFVDAGALAAAAELDGTSAGITRAVNAAGTRWTKYHLHSLSFPAPTVEFAPSSTGAWKGPGNVPSPPTDYRFARVTTNLTLPMYLMPIFTGTDNATVAARAVAGQINITSSSEGLLPFAVMAHSSDPTAGNGYGLIRGQSYTLRWRSAANPVLTAYIIKPLTSANKVSGF